MRFDKLALLTVILALGITVQTQTVTIQNDGSTFKVIGWQAPSSPPTGGWPPVFAVYVDTANLPLLGTYAVLLQLVHYGRPFAHPDIALLCVL